MQQTANNIVVVDNRVAGVGDRVAGVDDRVRVVDDRVAEVIRGMYNHSQFLKRYLKHEPLRRKGSEGSHATDRH